MTRSPNKINLKKKKTYHKVALQSQTQAHGAMAPSTTACAIKSAPWTTPWLPGLPVVCRFFFGFFFAAQETFPGHFQDISRTMAGKKREGERGKPREAGDDRIGRSRSAQPWAASADAREREREREKCWLVRNPLALGALAPCRGSSSMPAFWARGWSRSTGRGPIR